MTAKKVVILYSGGLDSRAMLELAKNTKDIEYELVHFNINQEYFKKELESIKKQGINVKIETFELVKSGQVLNAHAGSFSGNIIIPARNLFFIIAVAAKYAPDEIWLGSLLGELVEHATDNNLEFKEMVNNLLSYVMRNDAPTVVYPLVESGMNKLSAVDYLLRAGVSKKEIAETSSCLSGEHGNCGKCIVCFRRWGIFDQLNISEEYNTDPMTVDSNLKIAIEMIKGEMGYKCHYDSDRRVEIMPALYKKLKTKEPLELLDYLDRRLSK